MMYFSRGSPHCELMRTTFSVMLSMVKSFKTGTDLSPGSFDAILCFFYWLFPLFLLQRLTFSLPALPRTGRMRVRPSVIIAETKSLKKASEQVYEQLYDAVNHVWSYGY